MNGTRHFILFRRTEGHCATWLARAESLQDVLIRYALEECAGASLGEAGTLLVDDGYGGQTVYEHPLACIEAEEKIANGDTGWNGWEVRELRSEHWDADFAEVFCSENPHDIAGYIEQCRPLLRKQHPRSRAQAFVWYLHDGPLVTFYRRQNPRRRWPIQILGRYLLHRQKPFEVQEWSGSYDDILHQMTVEYPLP